MKTMNFYTQNGWAGSNYSSELSIKEIASKVRSYARKNFPNFKFSIRSEWSMYADSICIELKEGTCPPFVNGSRSAERGYMSTMSSVKGWEDELTPEIFKVLDAISGYTNSFRYDDSCSMEDYYDTNFYLNIKVSDEYKVVEPKSKKSSVKPEKIEETKELESVTVEGMEIVDYSEKAIAVFGDTKAVKDQLKDLGGKFNPSLKYNGEKRAGWIFSKKKEEKVRECIFALSEPPKEIDLTGVFDRNIDTSVTVDDSKFVCEEIHKEPLYDICNVELTYKPKIKSTEMAVIEDSNSAYSLLMNHIYDSETIQYREYMKLILLNNAKRVLGIVHISEGGLDSTSADIRIIMQAAILGNASAMILSHNHPSGNKQPSNQDDSLTDRVKKAAKLFNIQLLDHIIVTDSGYYSYLDEGRIL